MGKGLQASFKSMQAKSMTDPDILSPLRPIVMLFEKLSISYYIGKTSERQWRDIIGVIKVQKKNLDYKYLTAWSKKLGVWELLKSAFAECRVKI